MPRPLDAEVFRIQTDAAYGPDVTAGAAVVSFSVRGQPNSYLDFLLEENSENSSSSTLRGNLAFLIDPDHPPEIRQGKVHRLGLREASRGGLNHLAPNIVESLRHVSNERYALVCFVDSSSDSIAQRRAANVEVMDRPIKVIQNLGLEALGATVVLMRPRIDIPFTHAELFSSDLNRYVAVYVPDEGMVIKPANEEPHPEKRERPGDGRDSGGSDRHPRQPLIPQSPGSAEADIPQDFEFESLPVRRSL